MKPFDPAVEARVARLEKENRLLKAGGLLILVLVCAVCLMAQVSPVPKSISAQEFVVQGALTGKRYATLGVTGEGTALKFFDDVQRPRLILGLTNDNEDPVLRMLDENGEPYVTLGGMTLGTALTLSDQTGRSRVKLSALRHGSQLTLFDLTGHKGAQLIAAVNRPMLRILDGSQVERIRLGIARHDTLLVLRDEQGSVVFHAP